MGLPAPWEKFRPLSSAASALRSFSAAWRAQQEVDALKKQVAGLEAARTQDENRHQQLIDAVQQAKTELSGCLLDAGTNADERLEHNGTPIPGKKGWYSASTEFIHRRKRSYCTDQNDAGMS